MLTYLYVALGSATGGVARWSVGNWVQASAAACPPPCSRSARWS